MTAAPRSHTRATSLPGQGARPGRGEALRLAVEQGDRVPGRDLEGGRGWPLQAREERLRGLVDDI